MDIENLIPVVSICTTHHIETGFFSSLRDSGLVEVIIIEECEYIPVDQLPAIESIIRLHFDLGINLEGIEAIQHLLGRVRSMQQELLQLKNRLQFYEDPGLSSIS